MKIPPKKVFKQIFQLDATTLPIEEEEEDGEPLVKGEDDIPKGCWYYIIIIINI